MIVDAAIGAVILLPILKAGSARKYGKDGQQAWEKRQEQTLVAQAACASVCLAN